MKLTTRLLVLFVASLCIYSCSNNDTNSKGMTETKQPEFADNGKTVDSLKKVYNCENIDYENWGDKKAADSCLTVCLINSSKVPSGNNADEEANKFTAMALAIKKSLAKPQNYKSFYLIFVKKENVNGQETKVHSPGMEIPNAEL
ncbi:MAG: hypothetical protein JWQ27_391 [Ferruginibacter sp.]|nr:hypothetical protein [Ferruginibacter sp.]